MRTRITTTALLLLLAVSTWAQQPRVVSTWAQQPRVVSMTETTDIIAGDDQRRDLNNQPCALVKVQVQDDITDVDGNIMGDIINRGTEKWVYLAKGSRNMKILLKNNLPVKVMFKDYNISGLQGNRVYELVVNVPVKSGPTPDMPLSSLKMQVSPANANVTVWGDNQQRSIHRPDNSGMLKISLPYGRYYYKVEAKGYNSIEGNVFVNDENNVETITLAPYMGVLTIECPTPKASIFIDDLQVENVQSSTTSWYGQLAPGIHTVTIRRKGYVPQITTTRVEANQTTTLHISALQSERDIKKAEKKAEEEKRKAEQERIEAEKAKQKQQAITNTPSTKKDTVKQKKDKKNQQVVKSKDDATVRKTTWGVVAGYNIASASFDDDGGKYDGDTSSKGGIHLGVTLDVPLSPSFFFSTGLLYSGKGYGYESDYRDIDETANPQYLDIPLQLAYRLPLGRKSDLRLLLGPYLALCIGGKVTDEWPDHHYSISKKPLYDESFASAYTGLDYGLQAGVALDLSGFDIHMGYQMGMSGKYANRNFMIGIGYRF